MAAGWPGAPPPPQRLRIPAKACSGACFRDPACTSTSTAVGATPSLPGTTLIWCQWGPGTQGTTGTAWCGVPVRPVNRVPPHQSALRQSRVTEPAAIAHASEECVGAALQPVLSRYTALDDELTR
jgi:hypothetical protein